MGDQISGSQSDNGMSLGHMMLIAGVNQMEAQDDIFVAQREFSRDLGLQMLDDAEVARSKKLDAAGKQAIAEGIDAASTGLGALSNGIGSRKMGKIDVQKQGSPEFQSQYTSKETKLDTLKKTETELGRQSVDGTETGVDGETPTGVDNNGRTLSEVNEQEAQGWRDERSDLEIQLDTQPNLTPEQRATMRKRVNTLNKQIGGYDKLQSTKSEINTVEQDMQRLADTERRRIGDKLHMDVEMMSQVSMAAGKGLAATFRYAGESVRIEGEEYDTLQRWHGDRASAFEQYASQSMSTINGLSEQIMHAQETEQASIRRMTQA
ncbi:hypothetical protein AB1L42_01585 [Thalassoglobus sp. JC818]|uniref:hypothetical protein n=1 Tax=Thalassoglobus sp. JC818 TaxID=3232136 RepID=UPI00345A1D16